MKPINLLLTSQIVSAFDFLPLDEWVLTNFEHECGISKKTVLAFEVFPGNVDFDRSNFRAGACTQNDLAFTRTELDKSKLPEEQQALGRTRYTVTYDPETCTGVKRTADLDSYNSRVVFDFKMGYEFAGMRFAMRTYRIPAICEYRSQYDLRFDFGAIEDYFNKFPSSRFSTVQPVNGGPGFDLRVFRQPDLTEEVFPTKEHMKSGEIAYFTISPNQDLHSELTFAPSACRFVNEVCDEINNCREIKGMDVFNYRKSDCGQSPIFGSSLSYISEESVWKSQFRIFLFMSNNEKSTYVLRCNVQVCISACTEEDVIGQQQCNAIADSCLPENEIAKFKDPEGECPAPSTYDIEA